MYEVSWVRRAEQDYLNTLKFWIAHNKSNTFSVKLMNEVVRTEQLLSKSPHSGTLLDFERKIYRISILKHFSLIYKYENQTLTILAFWDNRRNPSELNL